MDTTQTHAGLSGAVTGGTGFIGRALLREIVPRYASVRVLARRKMRDVLDMGAVAVLGDLQSGGDLGDLVRAGDVLYHTVARTDFKGKWTQFESLTVGGTRAVLAHALPRSPGRVVFVSSAAVYPMSGRAPVSADTTPASPARYNYYGLALLAAERLVQEACDRSGVSWTILRLGATYGPGKLSLITQYAPLLREGRLRPVGRGDNAIAAVFVDDAASAIALAGEHPAAHRRIYDVAHDERVTQREWIDAAADALRQPRPVRHINRHAAFLLAMLGEWIASSRRREPSFTRAMVALASAEQRVDATAIRSELGWRPEVEFAEGVKRMQAWCDAFMKSRPGATGKSFKSLGPAPGAD